MSASISVIIPCYLCSQTIERAILSIANQTVQPFEVILIEDKSPDSGATLSLIHQLKEKYKSLNMVIITNEFNKGAASSRNAGLKIATGKYIAFLDADDSWHPQKLELQFNWLEVNSDVFLLGHHLKILDSSLPYYPAVLDMTYNHHASEITKKKILFSNTFSTPTVMLRNHPDSFFVEGERAAEDYFLWLKLILLNHKAYKHSLPLAFSYKQHFGEGGLSQNLWRMEKGELNCYALIFRNKLIRFPTFVLVSFVSILKYIRRFLIVRLFR